MTDVRESFSAIPMAANVARQIGGASIGGFLAVTTGLLTLTDADGTVLVNLVPVTAGVYTPIPFRFRTSAGGTITLSGGASGTLGT